MIEIFKTFTFDAAHHLATNVPADHPYARMHGHSFSVKVYLRGTPDPKTGWLMNFEELERALQSVQKQLDHRCLNEIKGLEVPTLENISRWIWDRLKPTLSPLHHITIWRGTLGEGCTFEG